MTILSSKTPPMGPITFVLADSDNNRLRRHMRFIWDGVSSVLAPWNVSKEIYPLQEGADVVRFIEARGTEDVALILDESVRLNSESLLAHFGRHKTLMPMHTLFCTVADEERFKTTMSDHGIGQHVNYAQREDIPPFQEGPNRTERMVSRRASAYADAIRRTVMFRAGYGNL